MSDIDRHQERALDKAHSIKSEQLARAFEKQLPTAKRNWEKMMEFTMKFSVDEKQRVSHLQNIQDFKLKGYYPEEVLSKDSNPSDERPITYSDDWEVWIRNQYAIKMSQNTSISEVGGAQLADIDADLRRSLMAQGIFVLGMKGGKTAVVRGEMGSGKTDFVLQEIVLNIYQKPRVQIVTNICIDDFNGMKGLPDNVKYAATIPQALRYILVHCLKKFDYLDEAKNDKDYIKREEDLKKNPFLTIWVVDEAGISNSKHDAMSKAWKVLRNLVKLSRKMKAMKIAIFQFDEAPDDIVRSATHNFYKPGTDHIDMVTFSVKNKVPELTLSGVLGWEQRKELGMPYIGYDTDDTAGMSLDDFDTQAALDYINAIGNGAPLGSRAQFTRFIEYLDILENKGASFSDPEAGWYFLYRVRYHALQEYDYYTKQAKIATRGQRKKELQEDAKQALMYSRWVFLCKIGKYMMPNEAFSEKIIKNRFDKIKERFPNIESEVMLPDNILPGPVKESPKYIDDNNSIELLDEDEEDIEGES